METTKDTEPVSFMEYLPKGKSIGDCDPTELKLAYNAAMDEAERRFRNQKTYPKKSIMYFAQLLPG